MQDVQFLSDEWLSTLDAAARARPRPDGDPLASVRLTIDHIVTGERHWRLAIEDGALSVEDAPDGDADVRMTSDRATAAAIASGTRAALDAFIAGDLRLGGDVRVLIEHRGALEAMGDVFAGVRSATDFT